MDYSPQEKKKKTSIFKLLLLMAIIAFAFLTIFVKNTPYFFIDLSVSRIVQRISGEYFALLMYMLSFLGDHIGAMILIFTGCAVLYFMKKPHQSFVLFFSSLGITLLGYIIKFAVARPRPDPSLINNFTEYTGKDSFPSGHVLFFIGYFGFLFYLTFVHVERKIWRTVILLILFILLILIGLSRIYLGAHWVSDVLGSYLIGFVWLFGVIVLYKNIKKK